MAYEPVLTALADPTRRAIIDRLRQGPCSVAEIASPLPVSRPAVSQHLKVMLDAELVTQARRGTRSLYALAPGGLEQLHGWLETLRADARAGAARATEAQSTETIPPISKSYDVRLSPAEAFALFTEDLALWWPVARHSLSAAANGGLPMTLVFHGGPEGRIEETQVTGGTGNWAHVSDWAPPNALTLRWVMGRPEAEATTVQLRLEPAGRGTRMTLVHGGWDALGSAGEDARDQYDSLWEHVLGARFTAAAHAALSNF